MALDHSLAWLGEDSAPKPFTTAQISAPWCVVADGKGRIFVSDQGATGMHKFTPDGQLSYRYLRSEAPASHQIKIFDTDGKLLFTMGQKGGRSEGSYNVADFMQPAGLAFDNHGRLWVSEFSQTPKRVTVWNVGADSAEIAAEFLGPAMYGGAAAMIDKKRPWELLDINYGTMFNINLNTCSFNVKSIPHYPLDFWKDQGHMPEQPFSGRPGIIRQVGDRKLSMLSGGYMHGDDANWSPNRASASGLVGIGEYVGDRFMIRAAIGTISGWMRARSLMSRRDNPWLAAPFMEAAKRLPEWQEYAHRMGIEEDAQDVPHWEHKRGAPFFTAVRWPVEINGVIWIDSNGDCRVQPEEIEFFESGFGSSWTFDDSMNIYWHNDPKRYGGEGGTFVLPHTGFNETGAPLYRAQNIRKISNTLIDIYHIGSDGSLLEKAALRNNDGTLRWSYPWSPKGIRSLGKDSRKTLKPGSMWRISNVHGVVDVPGLGEVYAVHSIDGMKYFLTRDDGLFIGSLFKPYAFAPGWDEIPGAIPGTDLNDYSLQDECFNAHFVRSDETAYGFKKGAYYLLGMSRSAIVEVAGLDKVHRFKGGEFTLKADTGLFGREEYFDPAEAFVPTIAVRKTDPLRVMKSRPGIDIFRGKAEDWMNNIARAGYDSRGIHFKIEVRGSKTSFKNSGEDITRLFTSGDCIDIQLQSPKLGTLRFVTAMSGDKPVTVRMRYNGALTDSAMLYRSGVGEVQVAEVNKVAQAKPSVRSIGGGGYVVQFCLPWQSLGFETMPAVGTVLPFEMGLGYSDETGTRTVTREFWRGGSGMVADLPTEAAPTKNWGKLVFEE